MAIDRFAPWAEDILQTCFHLWFIYFLCGYKRCKIFNDTSALTIIVNMFLSSAQMQDHPSFFKHNNQENKEKKKILWARWQQPRWSFQAGHQTSGLCPSFIYSLLFVQKEQEKQKEEKDIVSCLQDKQNNNHNSNNVASLVQETAVLLLLKFNGFLTSEWVSQTSESAFLLHLQQRQFSTSDYLSITCQPKTLLESQKQLLSVKDWHFPSCLHHQFMTRLHRRQTGTGLWVASIPNMSLL